MDIKNKSTKRTEEFLKVQKINEVEKYDYAKEGILSKCLPKIFFKGNSTLVTFLQLIDVKCIMLFNFTDKLKRFKWISWY